MITRPTLDLDLFTSPGRGVVADAGASLEATAVDRGWTIRRIRDGAEFIRLVVTGPADVIVVDLAVDATPEQPPTASIAGPTLDPDELAGRKVIALFDRAEARDFTDVHALAARYGTVRLLELAASVDRGFDECLHRHARLARTVHRRRDPGDGRGGSPGPRHGAARLRSQT